ncbi:helix-turn-helix domain-containing protein [Pseudactinotalea sp. HY160]|nr:helix-turn-helix domain-containing protein [Pseudactinotalea sp. HY160]
MRIVARREGRWWTVDIPELGVVTQARRLDQVRAMAREAAALALDVDESSIRVDLDIEVDDAIRLSWEAARDKEARARADAADAARLARNAVTGLRSQGLTQREAAEVLGVSYQRIAQLEKRAG